MKNYEVPEIHVTTDYSIFKKLKGNRPVEPPREKKIRESIESIGVIPAPIVVNEKMEIIDGQGREQTCERLGLPVYYIIVPGLGAKECVAMNTSSTNWNMHDYVNFYVENGNENYARLEALVEDHGVSLSVAVCAATGLMTTNNDAVRDGSFRLREEQYSDVDAMLGYVDSFNELIRSNGVSKSSMLEMALCFIYQHPEIDNDRMRKQFGKYGHRMKSVSKSGEVFECLTDIYNYHQKRDKVYIATKYYEYVDARYPWYENKWGKRSAVA